MPIITTPDGRYTFAIETRGEGDGNSVVYDGDKVVWDRFGYEGKLPNSSIPSIPPSPTLPILGAPIQIASNVNPIGMSYWRNINQHKGQSILKAFLSINDELTIFTIDKGSLKILEERKIDWHHTGEGCYFSAHDPSILYIPVNNRLLAFNIDNTELRTVWEGSSNLWQCHSSYDEDVHSATLKDSNWEVIGWAVLDHGVKKHFPIKGEPDECQIDKSGEYLIIKEDNYNRIINVQDGTEKIIQNEEGALGHSDCGFRCALGENDYSSYPGALDFIDFPTLASAMMYSTGIWNMGYFSFTNAKPTPLADQFGLITTPTELIKIQLNGRGEGIKICDNLTENQEYENRPKANLCPEGEFAIWTSWVGGNLNAYLVRV